MDPQKPEAQPLRRGELSSTIKQAMVEALETRWPDMPATPPAPAPRAEAQQDPPAPEPKDPVLRSLAQAINGRTPEQLQGHVIEMSQDKVTIFSPEEAAKRYEAAEMGQAPILGDLIKNLDGFRLLGQPLPIGSAIIGGITGTIVGEVIDGLVPPRNADGSVSVMNVAVNGLGAVALLQFGRGLVGLRASQFAAGAVIVRVASEFLPISQWVNNVVNMFRGNGGLFSQTAHSRQVDPVHAGLPRGDRISAIL